MTAIFALSGRWRGGSSQRDGEVLLAVVLTLVVFCSTQADACMVCLPMPRTTAADRLIEADVVAFARENPDQPFSYRALEVLKGELGPDEIELFVNSTTRGQLKANQSQVVVLVRDKDRSWRTVGIADRLFQHVVRRVLAMAPEWQGKRGAEKRCDFFMTLFGHDHRALFELAYLELGRAPYSTIKRIAPAITRDKLQAILHQPEYIEWRPLAILMLAQNADDEERNLVKTRFVECSRFGLTTNLAAWATAYIELDGTIAIEAIDQNYLTNSNRSEEEVRAVVTALSVHGRDGHTHMRDRIVRSYAKAIQDHPAVIGPIAQDLADWQRLDYREEVRRAFQRKGLVFAETDRQAIRTYLSLRPTCEGRNIGTAVANGAH